MQRDHYQKDTTGDVLRSVMTTSQTYHLPNHQQIELGEPKERFEVQEVSYDVLTALDD